MLLDSSSVANDTPTPSLNLACITVNPRRICSHTRWAVQIERHHCCRAHFAGLCTLKLLMEIQRWRYASLWYLDWPRRKRSLSGLPAPTVIVAFHVASPETKGCYIHMVGINQEWSLQDKEKLFNQKVHWTRYFSILQGPSWDHFDCFFSAGRPCNEMEWRAAWPVKIPWWCILK